MYVQDVLSHFKNVTFLDERGWRRTWMATCPCHDDKSRSLMILMKVRPEDQQVVGVRYDCHAGCAGAEIAKHLPDIQETLPAPAEPAGELVTASSEILPIITQMQEGMSALAEMLRVTNERMQALEAAVRTLEKVTPGQSSNINREIRNRAAEICGDWMMDGMEKKIAGEIRKTVRAMTGAQTAREIARCDYGSVMEMISGWEDYDLIQRTRKGVK